MRKAVAAIVLFEDKILIGKKVIKEGHFVSGGWHLPGGHVEDGESEEEALIREFKEETNLAIQIQKKICSYIVKETHTSLSWYVCAVETDKAVPGDDLTEIIFVKQKDVINKCDQRAITLWPPEVIKYLTQN